MLRLSIARSLRRGLAGFARSPRADTRDELVRRLEDERRRLTAIIESLGDALLVTEPGTSLIAAANRRASELLPELGVGTPADGPESPLPPLEDALRGEIVIEHRGRALAVSAAAPGNGGDGVVWTAHDITARSRLEHAKSEFVATASHELRSPLTSIKGFVELLHDAPEGMSERQLKFVEIILKSTDRLVDLVNDLLDVARLEAKRMELSCRPIDVGEAVREVAELMAGRIADKHQQLGVYIAPALPQDMADPGRVRQIVANLLTNAHLYTPRDGNIHVGVEPDRAWVQVVVEDSGVGMAAEESARVFEPLLPGADRRHARCRARAGDRKVAGRAAPRADRGGERARTRDSLSGAAADRRPRGQGRGTARVAARPFGADRRRRASRRRADRGTARTVRGEHDARIEWSRSPRAAAQRALRRRHARCPDAGDGWLRGAARNPGRSAAARDPDRVRVGPLRPPPARRRVGRVQTDRGRRTPRCPGRGASRRPLARAGARSGGAPERARAGARRPRDRAPVGDERCRGDAVVRRAAFRSRASRCRNPQSDRGPTGTRPAWPAAAPGNDPGSATEVRRRHPASTSSGSRSFRWRRSRRRCSQRCAASAASSRPRP